MTNTAANKRLSGLKGIVWLLLALTPIAFASQPIKVAVLIPSPPDKSVLWTAMAKSMEAAAHDLDINLKLLYSKPNSYRLKRNGEKLLSQTDKPDYFITGFFPSVTHDHLQLAEHLKIKTFVVNTQLTREQLQEVGVPRGKYKHWIGYMPADDYEAGYNLADALINRLEKKAPSGTIRIASLGGNNDSSVDELRLKGLQARINQSKKAQLIEHKLAQWNRESAYKITLKLLKQYPQLDAIAAASDSMAMGAIDAIKESEKKPGTDILVAGIDWSPEAIDAVNSGELTATIGGHLMDGAYALVMIYDYHNGYDFHTADSKHHISSMHAISIENVARFKTLSRENSWESIDFTLLSKALNKDLQEYSFSTQQLLNSINTRH